MIGTIRKHSAWLWVFIIVLTIISFVWWGASPAARNGGRAAGSFGTIYGREVTQEEYKAARAEFFISYWLRNQQWPAVSAKLSEQEIQKEIYWRILFAREEEKLGIHVGSQDTAQMAANLLMNLGRNHQPLALESLLGVLRQQGFSALDLNRALSADLATEQLVQAKGLAGALVTPQEVSEAYDHDHQGYVTEGVFFEATNYLSRVAVSSAAVGQFYTNYMALYREPDRVQLNYVFFNVTNYLAHAKQEWQATNFEEVVTDVYNRQMDQFADEKTPEAAKAKIRELLIRQRAGGEALKDAREFAQPVFDQTNSAGQPDPAGLLTVARQKGLTVRTTLPFSQARGPEELDVAPNFTKVAFSLNEDTPAAGPVQAADGFYVVALARRLPSAVPPLEQIQDRVVQDFRSQQALGMAQQAGTNFYFQASVLMAMSNTFAQAAVAVGAQVRTLPVFSLSTQDLPEAGDENTLEQLKQAAFSTPVGRFSSFMPAETGGFVLRVKSVQPADPVKKAEDLPEFTASIRRQRVNSAFNIWLETTSRREFRGIALLQSPSSGGAAR